MRKVGFFGNPRKKIEDKMAIAPPFTMLEKFFCTFPLMMVIFGYILFLAVILGFLVLSHKMKISGQFQSISLCTYQICFRGPKGLSNIKFSRLLLFVKGNLFFLQKNLLVNICFLFLYLQTFQTEIKLDYNYLLRFLYHNID